MASWWIVEQEGLGGAFSRAFERYLYRPPSGAHQIVYALEVPSWWVDAHELAHRFTWAEANQVVHALRRAIAAHQAQPIPLRPFPFLRVRAVEVDESTRALLDLAAVE